MVKYSSYHAVYISILRQERGEEGKNSVNGRDGGWRMEGWMNKMHDPFDRSDSKHP